MAYKNGQFPSTALTTVAPGVQLANASANAYKALRLIGAIDKITIRPAAGVGSGYRSLAVQRLFYAADHGDRKAAAQVGLNGASNVAVAVPGSSSHGTGTRIDLLFNGSASPNSTDIDLAKRFGWTREFGSNDPNHFKHDGHTATSGPSADDQHRIIAHYLNNRHLGKTTATEQDGKRDASATVYQIYTWLLQAAGHADGLYPVPPYLHDGKWGPRTAWLEKHYWSVLWND